MLFLHTSLRPTIVVECPLPTAPAFTEPIAKWNFWRGFRQPKSVMTKGFFITLFGLSRFKKNLFKMSATCIHDDLRNTKLQKIRRTTMHNVDIMLYHKTNIGDLFVCWTRPLLCLLKNFVLHSSVSFFNFIPRDI